MGSSFSSPSGILAQERKLCRDLVHSNKKEQEFRSIFHHIQSAQSQRSPSELFAQHIVTIVHHVRGGSGVRVSSGKVHSSLEQMSGVCALEMPRVVFQQIFQRWDQQHDHDHLYLHKYSSAQAEGVLVFTREIFGVWDLEFCVLMNLWLTQRNCSFHWNTENWNWNLSAALELIPTVLHCPAPVF